MTLYECDACKYETHKKSAFDSHLLSKKHQRQVEDVDISGFKHQCESCKYGTNSIGAFDIHVSTNRHMLLCNETTEWGCPCGKQCHSQRAFTYHKKKCTFIPPSPPSSQPSAAPPQQPDMMAVMTTLVETMMQSQSHQTQQIIQAISSGNLANNTTNNTMNDHSTTNNTMNLNVFLDEHCKDAMNLTDFFDKIKVHQSDLLDVLRVKNPKAISNILQRELGKLSITERPIHCTDVKRKKMFVKDNDKWTSEQGTDKIDKVINSTCAHQYNTWGVRVRNTDREDRAEQHYDDTAAMGAILGKQMDGWGEPGNRLMQETQNDICNMVYLTKDDARDVLKDVVK